MAKKREDAAAAKAKKQKVVLIVGVVLLLAVGAIQGPKLMKRGSSAALPVPAVEAAATPEANAGSVAAPAAGSATGVKISGPRASAVLAGVTIQGTGRPALDAGQLVAFSLFEAKDPFVPQTSDELSGTTEPTATPTLSDTQPGKSGGTGTASAPGGATAAPPVPAAATTDATILLNGRAYYLGVKDAFPKAEPLFVLVSLKPKVARIGVAGGTFADAETIPLAKGKKVTVVNDATGARYVLKLVYTGSEPEQTESFTPAGK